MPFARLASLPAAGMIALFLAGCAAPIRVYTPEELRAELDMRVSTQMRDEIVIPFEIDDEIRQLARDATRNASTDDQKVQALVRTIIGLAGFSISYDWLSNKTAREVFREGRGNCLAYSNLFIGMARAVGVDARYADVRFRERVTREADVVVHSDHITAAVRQPTGTKLIDFTSTPERKYIGFEVIDDLEAISSFYNNQGFLYGYFTEDVEFDALEKELEMYRLALEILPSSRRARNNLGVAYRRRGRIDEAIEQFKLAIEAAPGYDAPYSNLGKAYADQGRTDEALETLQLGVQRAGKQGFIHHHLGILYLRLARYDEAIHELRRALEKEPDLAGARFHLGECYRHVGEEEKARQEFERALELDPNLTAARMRLEGLSRPVPPGSTQGSVGS